MAGRADRAASDPYVVRAVVRPGVDRYTTQSGSRLGTADATRD